MFGNDALKQHLQTSSVIQSQSLVVAEWNMNVATNILQAGNYRYRLADSTSPYNFLAQAFSLDDAEARFYTDATDSDVVVDGGYDNNNVPVAFLSKREKEKALYSLEDCFGRFRPRSGINKVRYFEDNYAHFANIDMGQRPRYYMADKHDKFKYWTSYRLEEGIERGIANVDVEGQYFIEDAAPYIVYKNPVPSNRVVVKMQTNVGSVDLGPFNSLSGEIEDPFYGQANQTTPIRWRIQYLDNDNWFDAIRFDQNSQRSDGSPIIGSDGYVEIVYGLIVPDEFKSNFYQVKEYPSEAFLPSPSEYSEGAAFLIKETDADAGYYKIVNSAGSWSSFAAKYGWYVFEEGQNSNIGFVTELVDTPKFQDINNKSVNREFQYIKGLRVVVETMNRFDSTFDLIELSPRLSVNITDKVSSFSITKPASDLGQAGMPVGQLLASSGSLQIFDYDQAFFPENTNSIISGYRAQYIQFKFYENIINVNGSDYTIPIKTLYSEGFPAISNSDRTVSIEARDLFFYFESMTAPEILLQNVSVSFAIAMLLDSVGFSNYTFLRNEDEGEDVIPFFFIPTDTSVAEVLENIALATQSAMFFDEENNFVVMSKNYMMPTEFERDTDIVLYGSQYELEKINNEEAYRDNIRDTGVRENDTRDPSKISNIIEISAQDNHIYNDGTINYTSRYIQRSYGSIQQATVLAKDKSWVYKPALLWEVAPTENTTSENEETGQQSAYALTAIPLNSDLSNLPPSVENHTITNNIIDLGDGIYYIARYNGYFYANGEIIKYDAVQYSVPGLSATSTDPNVVDDNVWITSVREYQKYFSKIPFGGKMYPTGLVRIYAEPNYEIVEGFTRLKNGPVAKHGRAQFGTGVRDSDGAMSPASHYAGLNPHWLSTENMHGCVMDSSILFSENDISVNVLVDGSAAGLDENQRHLATEVTSLFKNLLTSTYNEETEYAANTNNDGMTQASALIMKGSSKDVTGGVLTDFISYINRPINNRFQHFGTRMRVIGKLESNDVIGQTASGATTYAANTNSTADQPAVIAGGSGGLGIMINPETNSGYFLELIAFNENNNTNIGDVVFYKVTRDAEATQDSDKAVPVRLWSGNLGVVVDYGNFAAQQRLYAESDLSVYDVAVEYEKVSETGGLRFYVYVNNTMIAIIDDSDPLPIYNNFALFVRGSSQCAFENVYALSQNYSKKIGYGIDTEATPANSALSFSDITSSSALQKYAMSGLLQSTYMSGVSTTDDPDYDLYFEEFGTIMRECAYFDIKYDKAYPALYAQLSPTINKNRGYVVSGFIAGSYGAEFLVFNATDTILNLDSTSGNYLRIQGITFTQNSEHQYTVDEFYEKNGSLSDQKFVGSDIISSPYQLNQDYKDIKLSRLTHGTKAFSLSSPYIQSQDTANSLMSWFTTKIMKPRRSVGLKLFGLSNLQLGDIVKINYINEDGINQISADDSRFVVYHLEYNRDSNGPDIVAYLSEVVL